ncbi:MAG: FAD/NAD(P)-binding protein [Bacteroidia bacterium]|nr:FAD/NAD(P)-binding protein [Bacteroidia bacterium]
MSVAIIGAGASGVLTCFHLHRLKPGTKIYLIESNPVQAGKGLAYSTGDETHLLNVAAGKMSAFPEEPGHFLNWLIQNNYSFTEDSFVPRKLYGNYIKSILDALLPHITLIKQEAVGLAKKGEELEILLANGEKVTGKKVLLALGNFPPSSVGGVSNEIKLHPAYHGNPWKETVFKNLTPQENIFIIGSGLTMVDMAMTLSKLNHRGKILSVSTHGFLPQVHEKTIPYPDFYADLKNCNSVNSLTIKMHRHIARAARNGINWRAVVDAIRPHTQELWLHLSVQQKKEFIDKIRHIWGVARHRIPAESNAILNNLIEKGQMKLKAGRILQITPQQNQLLVEYKLRSNQQPEQFLADRIINCTGPESDFKKVLSPLVQQLLRNKMIHCDPLQLGINAHADGRVMDEGNVPSENLYTIGPCMKGILWECTAVPEIRHQSLAIAQKLVK